VIRAVKLLAVLAGVTFAAAAPAAGNPAPAFKAGVYEPVLAAPDFKLPSSAGGEVSLAAYRGKVVLLAFGFTSCAEVCPVTLHKLASARRKLGSKAADLQVVYVTVDPERDDAARMRKYLASFDPTFVGAVGAPADLAKVRERYGITADKHQFADGNYVIAHSSSVYMIDRQGGLKALMPYANGVDDFVHDLKIMLGQ
jgi:protein SCO1/2